MSKVFSKIICSLSLFGTGIFDAAFAMKNKYKHTQRNLKKYVVQKPKKAPQFRQKWRKVSVQQQSKLKKAPQFRQKWRKVSVQQQSKLKAPQFLQKKRKVFVKQQAKSKIPKKLRKMRKTSRKSSSKEDPKQVSKGVFKLPQIKKQIKQPFKTSTLLDNKLSVSKEEQEEFDRLEVHLWVPFCDWANSEAGAAFLADLSSDQKLGVHGYQKYKQWLVSESKEMFKLPQIKKQIKKQIETPFETSTRFDNEFPVSKEEKIGKTNARSKEPMFGDKQCLKISQEFGFYHSETRSPELRSSWDNYTDFYLPNEFFPLGKKQATRTRKKLCKSIATYVAKDKRGFVNTPLDNCEIQVFKGSWEDGQCSRNIYWTVDGQECRIKDMNENVFHILDSGKNPTYFNWSNIFNNVLNDIGCPEKRNGHYNYFPQ